MDDFGVGKRHCRLLNSRVVDGYINKALAPVISSSNPVDFTRYRK